MEGGIKERKWEKRGKERMEGGVGGERERKRDGREERDRREKIEVGRRKRKTPRIGQYGEE